MKFNEFIKVDSGLVYEQLHNRHFARLDIEEIKKLRAEIRNMNEAEKPPESEYNHDQEEEKKQEFMNSSENILKSALKLKETGVEHFKKNQFKEALSCFSQAQQIFEKEFSQEIKNKTPFVLDDYVKLIRNSALSHFQMKDYQQADEKLDFLLSILPEDQRTLEIKANNFRELAFADSKIHELSHEMLKKAQETLHKLMNIENVSKSDKSHYQEQLKKIESEILNRNPDHKKTLKLQEDFEKQIKNVRSTNAEEHDSFLQLLKVETFDYFLNIG